MSADIPVTRNDERHRFEAVCDGEVAGYAEFRLRDGGVIEFTHTVVDDRFEGRGVGSTLVAEALDQVRAEGLEVIATCPFVRSYIERHQEYADLLAS
jgi:predicted GNAT family acetyltransferase